MLMSIGLRPFFLLAGLYACLAMAAWLAWLGPGIAVFPAAQAGASLPDVIWHGHELLFGFATAVIAGFMLTAVPNWTGSTPLSGAPLGVLVVLWIAGRAAVWLSGVLPPTLVAVVDLAFLPTLGAMMALPLIRARAFRNIIFLVLLAVLFGANLLVHLELMGLSEDTARTGILAGLNLVLLLITIVGGRVVPAFTGNWLKAGNIAEAVVRRPVTDALAMAAMALVLIGDLAGAGAVIAGWLALAAAAAHLIRMAGWQTRQVLRTPILWILHLGYGWLVVGFALKAMSLLGDFVTPAAALHALSIGAVGSMTLGVMSRAALGHTGRALQASPAIAAAYGLVSLAAMLRIYGLMFASGACWILAFAIFSAVYWPILTRPPAES